MTFPVTAIDDPLVPSAGTDSEIRGGGEDAPGAGAGAASAHAAKSPATVSLAGPMRARYPVIAPETRTSR